MEEFVALGAQGGDAGDVVGGSGEVEAFVDDFEDGDGAGARPRPSLKWQPAQERALKSGPSPSRAVVEAGAVTQFWLKKELPTKKSSPCSRVRPGAGRLKASGVVSKTVAAPPANSSRAAR